MLPLNKINFAAPTRNKLAAVLARVAVRGFANSEAAYIPF